MATNRKAGVLLLLGLATAACQDLPTGQRPAEDRVATTQPAGSISSSKPGYTCLISKRTPAGPQQYHYTRVRGIQLPASVEDRGGKTTLLQLTFQSPGEPVFARVNCRVPATKAALDMMLGIFVRPAPQAALSPARASGGLRGMDVSLFVDSKRRRQLLSGDNDLPPSRGPRMDAGCVTAGQCALPGVTAYGYPPPSYTNPWDQCYWGCGWNASAGDYGGSGPGSDYDPGVPSDGEDEAQLKGDYDTIPAPVPYCNAPRPGMEYARCNSFTPIDGSDLDKKVRASLDRISRRGSVCAAIAEKGFEMLNQGKIGFFYGRQAQAMYGDAGGYGGPWGVLLDYDYWMRFYDGEDRIGRSFDNGLAHEIEHAMGLQHVDEDARYPTTPNAYACGG